MFSKLSENLLFCIQDGAKKVMFMIKKNAHQYKFIFFKLILNNYNRDNNTVFS